MVSKVEPLEISLEHFQKRGEGRLPGFFGIEFIEVTPKRAVARLELRAHHLAPNGYLHAATLVAVADTACGYGCLASLPDGAENFTTIELIARCASDELFWGRRAKGRFASKRI